LYNLATSRYTSEASRHMVIKIMPRLGKANYKVLGLLMPLMVRKRSFYFSKDAQVWPYA